MIMTTTTMMMTRCRSAEVGESEAEEGVESMLLGLPSCHWVDRSSRGRLPQFWRWQGVEEVTFQLQVATSELPPPERGCQSPIL